MNIKSTLIKISMIVIGIIVIFIVVVHLIYPVYKQVVVIDGDTILVKHNDTENIVIRYACIDAPEKDDLLFNEAKSENTKYIENNEVIFKILDIDRYNRKIAYVYADKKISLLDKITMIIVRNTLPIQSVNKKLLYHGWAIYYDVSGKCKDFPGLLKAQKHAFDNGLGIWHLYTKFKDRVFFKGRRTIHLANCKLIKSKRKLKITLKEAIYKGLSPCRSCKPLSILK